MNKSIAMKKLLQLSDIPNKPYEGYLWFSDSRTPVILDKEEYPFAQLSQNPFIVEGLLYCAEDQTSITIKHTGVYQIGIYKVDQSQEGVTLKPIEYLPHRLTGINKVCFQQLWLPESDPFCEGMKVLKMKALLFTGFKR